MQGIMAPATSAKRTKLTEKAVLIIEINSLHILSYTEITSVYTEQCCYGFVNVYFLSCEDMTL
jgi:hypothetical protein